MAIKKTQKKAPANRKSTYKNNRYAPARNSKNEADSTYSKTTYSQGKTVILFSISILLFFVTIIQGDNFWNIFHNFIWGIFGKSSFLFPIFLIYISVISAFGKQNSNMNFKIWISSVILLLFSSSFYIFTSDDYLLLNFQEELINLYILGTEGIGAGLFSGLLGIPFVYALGKIGAEITVIILLFVMIMFLTGKGLVELFDFIAKPFTLIFKTNENESDNNEDEEIEPISCRSCKMKNPIDISLEPDNLPNHPVSSNFLLNKKKVKNEKFENLKRAFGLPFDNNRKGKSSPKNLHIEDTQEGPFFEDESSAAAAAAAFIAKKKLSESKPDEGLKQPEIQPVSMGLNDVLDGIGSDKQYKFPPSQLLNRSIEANSNDIENELQVSGQMLVNTLKNFNVQTKIVDISRGPAVTRYELQPAAGVKISKITNLSDDIALNLAASGVRIEAPIPGKAAVGIEIPNKFVNIVRMNELVQSNIFAAAKSKLTVILGRDISGKITLADLSKMPHLLIAGSTGSGKSVCINSFIISLLYKSTPDEVRLLMIDPKVVELGIYNGIPHLLVPVVTDPRKAAGALNWAVTEMLKRYKIFAEHNVRDLQSYNKTIGQKIKYSNKDTTPLELMPQIVIIIDELADLMMAAPNEVEDSICRLAQMARAAGMHLVIATQRPSVDVITGIIKANIPSRIALAVSSQIDSRTILDMSGAEKLLGRGDMLFSPIGAQKPVRVQGCYVTDEEIEQVIAYIKESGNIDYDQKVIEEIDKNAVLESGNKTSYDNGSTDPMMNEAIECIIETGQASTSFLQRRLRLGYARAGRLIDEMEQMGIIGPPDGSKARQVLMTYQQFLERNIQNSDKNND